MLVFGYSYSDCDSSGIRLCLIKKCLEDIDSCSRGIPVYNTNCDETNSTRHAPIATNAPPIS